MGARPALSKAELEVARVLWELGEATVRQVHETLSASRKIDFATVQTYMRRLESKGYARAASQFRCPAVSLCLAQSGPNWLILVVRLSCPEPRPIPRPVPLN